MKLSELKKTDITRRDEPAGNQTAGKDEVADYIENEIIEEDRWPMDIIDIADEVDYSRQHTTNVIRQYFRPVDADCETSETEDTQETDGSVTITVPDDIDDEQSFWRGVAEARRV